VLQCKGEAQNLATIKIIKNLLFDSVLKTHYLRSCFLSAHFSVVPRKKVKTCTDRSGLNALKLAHVMSVISYNAQPKSPFLLIIFLYIFLTICEAVICLSIWGVSSEDARESVPLQKAE